MALSGSFGIDAAAGHRPAPELRPVRPGRLGGLVSHLALALAVVFAMGWLGLLGRDSESFNEGQLRERLALQSAAADGLAAEVRTLRAALEATRVGPEHRFEKALLLDREARYVEAAAAYDELAAMYPGHELAARARGEARRVRRLGWDRNMVSLQLSVTDVQVGWTAHLGADGESAALYPQLSLRLRNVGGEPLLDGHIRVDFVLASDATEVIGHGLAVIEPLGPTEARLVTLRSLEAVVGDLDPATLPDVAAHLWLRRAETGFLEIGVFPLGREVVSLR